MTSFFQAAGYVIGAFVIVIVLNVLTQLFPKKNEPPVVFHLVPYIGNAVTYGVDPYKFLKAQREKVRSNILQFEEVPLSLTRCIPMIKHF